MHSETHFLTLCISHLDLMSGTTRHYFDIDLADARNMANAGGGKRSDELTPDDAATQAIIEHITSRHQTVHPEADTAQAQATTAPAQAVGRMMTVGAGQGQGHMIPQFFTDAIGMPFTYAQVPVHMPTGASASAFNPVMGGGGAGKGFDVHGHGAHSFLSAASASTKDGHHGHKGTKGSCTHLHQQFGKYTFLEHHAGAQHLCKGKLLENHAGAYADADVLQQAGYGKSGTLTPMCYGKYGYGTGGHKGNGNSYKCNGGAYKGKGKGKKGFGHIGLVPIPSVPPPPPAPDAAAVAEKFRAAAAAVPVQSVGVATRHADMVASGNMLEIPGQSTYACLDAIKPVQQRIEYDPYIVPNGYEKKTVTNMINPASHSMAFAPHANAYAINAKGAGGSSKRSTPDIISTPSSCKSGGKGQASTLAGDITVCSNGSGRSGAASRASMYSCGSKSGASGFRSAGEFRAFHRRGVSTAQFQRQERTTPRTPAHLAEAGKSEDSAELPPMDEALLRAASRPVRALGQMQRTHTPGVAGVGKGPMAPAPLPPRPKDPLLSSSSTNCNFSNSSEGSKSTGSADASFPPRQYLQPPTPPSDSNGNGKGSQRHLQHLQNKGWATAAMKRHNRSPGPVMAAVAMPLVVRRQPAETNIRAFAQHPHAGAVRPMFVPPPPGLCLPTTDC